MNVSPQSKSSTSQSNSTQGACVHTGNELFSPTLHGYDSSLMYVWAPSSAEEFMLNPTTQQHSPSHSHPKPCRCQNSQVESSSQTSSFGQSGITFIVMASMGRRAQSGRKLGRWSVTDEITLNGRIAYWAVGRRLECLKRYILQIYGHRLLWARKV